MLKMRCATYAATLAALVVTTTAFAQAWPVKPVRVIVPNPPGGLNDIATRLVAAKLSESLGQQFVVENRVGAGGTIGTAIAARAPADGYTLLSVFDAHATNPHLFRKLEYDTFRDFAPVALLVSTPMVLVVRNGLEAKSVEEFIRLAKANPGKINFAVAGPGSPARLLMEALKVDAGVDVTMISYKGANLALGDLIGGQVDAMFTTTTSVVSHLKAGRVKALALASEKRSPLYPDLPPMSETIPGFGTDAWVGLLAPARVPEEVVARLNAEVNRILRQPDVRARLAEQGTEALGGTPAEFERFMQRESARWGKIIREQKILLD